MRTLELRLRLSQGLHTSPRTVGRFAVFAIVAGFLLSGVLVLQRLSALPRTDDAIVTANTIKVIPEVAGRIATLNVKDDATVHKGDVLFTIESERYELNLAQARAQVQALEAQIDLTDRAVSSQVTGISVARAHAESARARVKEATETLQRMEPLLAQGFVTAHQIDLARTTKATAESQLAAALSATRQTQEAVGDSKALAAQLLGARALVGQAERDLRNTVVRAPFDGRVVGVTTAVGQMVDPVRPLFTMLDTSQWYIIADFRETELPSIRPGDQVTGYVMTEPGTHLRGSVESVGSAVAELDDLALAGVPPVRRDLNWIRIAQRFPVRIALEGPPPELMRIGASAVVVVRHGRR
ncbi:MAG TPA: biotin/lipoyl-binding protein [Myxococcaceae bacterium]|nr:biotin/lipoyl-binding protein [Myxococcaceae bacterium]